MPTQIELRDVSCAYGAAAALNKVTLKAQAGERIMLVGPNGAGKSTLLKSLCCINGTVSGQILLEGKDLAAYSRIELARLVSYVAQFVDSPLDIAVEEFLRLARYARQELDSEGAARAKIECLVDLCGLKSFLPRNLKTLSGGERQRVFIAAALAQEPKVLLLDEPTQSLDPRQSGEVEKVLDSIAAEQNLSLIEATHDINRAALKGRRIVALKAGQVVFDGASSEFMQVQVLERIFEKTFILEQLGNAPCPIALPEM
jgi:iron complex transport system ATP-binding protein